MEENVFSDPAVAGSLQRMVEGRLHNDGAHQDEVKALQQRLTNSLATPSYVIMDPATEEVIDTHLGPELDEPTFNAWLQKNLR